MCAWKGRGYSRSLAVHLIITLFLFYTWAGRAITPNQDAEPRCFQNLQKRQGRAIDPQAERTVRTSPPRPSVPAPLRAVTPRYIHSKELTKKRTQKDMLIISGLISPGLVAVRHVPLDWVGLSTTASSTTLNIRACNIVACSPFEDSPSPEDMAMSLQVLSLPREPTPELSPVDVVHALCSGLKHNHVPNVNDGVRRVYYFTTYECRASLTSRKGYKSGVEKFVEHASLFALPGCTSFQLVGEPAIIPATQTRGALASVGVDVVEQLSFRFASGFERSSAPTDDSQGTRTERYLFQLAQERRPPLIGCWMLTSIMPARDHMLVNGDAGSVQG